MQTKELVVRVATVASVLIAVAVALLAMYLLVVGTTLTTVAEVPYGEPMLPPTMERVPYRPAVIPLAAAALLITGLLAKKLIIAWIGLAVLFLFSVLAMFSWGLAFLPAAALLLVLVITIRVARRSPGQSRPG